MSDPDRYCAEIERDGFAIVAGVLPDEKVGLLRAELERVSAAQSMRRGKVYAARNLLATIPAVAALAQEASVRWLVEPILGREAFAVRGILFDKIPGANWRVGWHQDQVIPVAERREVPGFAAWSVKRGVPHVRPPAAVLERMLTLRLHLDDCGTENGALEVIPGSHRRGLLTDEEFQAIVDGARPVPCEARSGTVLAMRPLLVHSSMPALAPRRRRIIHLEFAAEQLPGGLRWPNEYAAMDST